MKLSGWVFMIAYWGFIIWLVIFSFAKILTKEKKR